MNANLQPRLAAYVERTAIWIPATIIGFLLMPMVFTRRSFGHDWTLHLWAIRQQEWNIRAMGHPGLFVSAKPLGAFYPIFAFVGSGIYSVGGYAALVVGPILAYKLLYLVGLCLAYGGLTWLSVQFGLLGWRSQTAGAVLVTGAYYITDFAGRGDLGEFIAVSSIPFLLASMCALVMSPSVRLRHRLAVILAVFVLSGSHNITLLWGSFFVSLLGLLAVLGWAPTWRRPLPWRRLGQLAGLGLLGAGLNAWYLFPDLAYGLDTVVGAVSKHTRPGPVFVHPALLLNPFRPADHSPTIVSFFARDIRLSFPVLFFAWALVTMTVLWRGRDWAAKRLFLGCVALSGAFVVFLVAKGPWTLLPRVFWSVQFTWRLDSYVLLGTAFLVMIALVWQTSAPDPIKRLTSGALVAIVVFSAGAATWQVWRVRSEYIAGPFERAADGHFVDKVVASRYAIPPSWYPSADFRDVSTRVVVVPTQRALSVPLTEIHGSSFSGTLAVPDGPAPFNTNIAAGSRFVQMTGIKAVGRALDGFIVAERAAGSPPAGPVTVTIRQADSAVLRSGAIVSVLSALGLVTLIAWPLLGIVRRRSRRGQSPPTDPI